MQSFGVEGLAIHVGGIGEHTTITAILRLTEPLTSIFMSVEFLIFIAKAAGLLALMPVTFMISRLVDWFVNWLGARFGIR